MASERSRQCNRKFGRVLCKSPAPSWLTPAKRLHCMYTLLLVWLLVLLLHSSLEFQVVASDDNLEFQAAPGRRHTLKPAM